MTAAQEMGRYANLNRWVAHCKGRMPSMANEALPQALESVAAPAAVRPTDTEGLTIAEGAVCRKPAKGG